MIRKYHNRTLPANQRHREEEPHNTENHKTPRKQFIFYLFQAVVRLQVIIIYYDITAFADTCVDHGSCQLLMRHYDVCKYPTVARQFCRWSCRVCDVPTICEDTTYDCDLTQTSTPVNICSDYQVTIIGSD